MITNSAGKRSVSLALFEQNNILRSKNTSKLNNPDGRDQYPHHIFRVQKTCPNKSEFLECLGKYLDEIISKSALISAAKTQKIISKELMN